ncbi:MAG: phospholipid carrier-dependent glycosyltransferase [bacterium]|nr:phospholipid carrier-dependent glycosyltransferase [bacterium]
MSVSSELRSDRGRWQDILLMTGLWALMTYLAHPVGDFPLNDDWTYGVSVKALVEEGRMFFLTEWACKTLVAHVFWGALFCLPFGFSYTALRVSQLTAGLIGGIATYYLCLELGASRRTALLCSLTLLVNPLYFQLSNSFMTDVGFTAGATLALLLLIKGMFQSSRAISALGWILVVLSVWVRELTLMIPAGFAMTQFYRDGISFKVLLRAALPLAVIFVLLWVHQHFLVDLWGFPNLDNGRSNAALTTLIEKPLKFAILTTGGTAALFLYLGLFALPMLLWYRSTMRQSETAFERKLTTYLGIAWLLVVIRAMYYYKRIMPVGKNLLYDSGLGPATLRDTYLLGIENLPTAPVWVWGIVTVMSLWGAWEVLRLLVRVVARVWEMRAEGRRDTKRWLLFALLMMTALYTAAIVTSGYFDRYLLIYLPIMAALFTLLSNGPVIVSRASQALAIAMLCVLGVFGALATHDYISWNRVRWELVSELNGKMGIPPNKVDGGYEVNGTLMFDIGLTKAEEKSWWWVDDDEYVLAFGPIPGYESIEHRTFPNYFYTDETAVHILKRKE